MEAYSHNSFHWPDYLVFFLTMAVALSIGVYHAIAGRKKKTTGEYLLASRKMNALPVAISLLISYVSAVTLIGNGSEMYFYGIHYWFYLLSVSIALILCCLLFVPLYHPLQLTSIHQYLHMRYSSRVVELTATVLQLLSLTLMNAVFLFGPCIMMESVTGFPTWLSMIITGVLATVYTTIGGFKAVIWADVFQTVLILIGLLFILIQGTIAVGGVGEVWNLFADSGRFEVDWSFSPLKRLTFPTAGVVMSAQWLSFYAILQPSAQRFLAVESISSARRVVLGVIPGVLILGSLACSLGIVAFAYFTKVGCDPYRAGLITNQNQIVPYFVMEIIQVPAIPGLFMACVFAGSLSNLSSFLNAGAAILWNDLFAQKFRMSTEARQTAFTKFLAFIMGLATIAAGFAAAHAGGTLVQITFSISSASLTPIFILFALGATFPRINSRSALVGACCGIVFPLWLSMAATLRGSHQEPLPTVTTNCTVGNSTTSDFEDIWISPYNETSMPPDMNDQSSLDAFYSISQFWYQPIGIFTGMIVALIVSLLPGFHSNDRQVDARLYFPYVRWILKKSDLYELYEAGHEMNVYFPPKA